MNNMIEYLINEKILIKNCCITIQNEEYILDDVCKTTTGYILLIDNKPISFKNVQKIDGMNIERLYTAFIEQEEDTFFETNELTNIENIINNNEKTFLNNKIYDGFKIILHNDINPKYNNCELKFKSCGDTFKICKLVGRPRILNAN